MPAQQNRRKRDEPERDAMEHFRWVPGPWIGAAAGPIGGLVAIGFLYGPVMIKDKEPDASMPNPNEQTSAAKIDYVD